MAWYIPGGAGFLPSTAWQTLLLSNILVVSIRILKKVHELGSISSLLVVSPHKWVVFHPLYTFKKNQGPLFHCSKGFFFAQEDLGSGVVHPFLMGLDSRFLDADGKHGPNIFSQMVVWWWITMKKIALTLNKSKVNGSLSIFFRKNSRWLKCHGFSPVNLDLFLKGFMNPWQKPDLNTKPKKQ